MITVGKKLAKDLVPGDVIPPPANERGWLRTPVTVVEVAAGKVDARGPWLAVTATYQSPYGPNQARSKFLFRPTTEVRLVEVQS